MPWIGTFRIAKNEKQLLKRRHYLGIRMTCIIITPRCVRIGPFFFVACLALFPTCFPALFPCSSPVVWPGMRTACVPRAHRLFPFLPLLSAVSHALRTSGGHFPCFQPRGSPHVLLLRAPLADFRCLSPSGPRPVLKVEICQSQGAQPLRLFVVMCDIMGSCFTGFYGMTVSADVRRTVIVAGTLLNTWPKDCLAEAFCSFICLDGLSSGKLYCPRYS
jgi:hypothetical protein